MAPIRREKAGKNHSAKNNHEKRVQEELPDVSFEEDDHQAMINNTDINDNANDMDSEMHSEDTDLDEVKDHSKSDDIDIDADDDNANERPDQGKPRSLQAKKQKPTLPPTADEIQELRETEELFKSNVFKWQMEDLLKRQQVPYAKCGSLEKAFWDVKSVLDGMQEQPEADVKN